MAKARAEIEALKQERLKNNTPWCGQGILVTPSPRRPLGSTQKPATETTQREGVTPTPSGTPPTTPATTPSPASTAAAKVEGDQQGGTGSNIHQENMINVTYELCNIIVFFLGKVKQ